MRLNISEETLFRDESVWCDCYDVDSAKTHDEYNKLTYVVYETGGSKTYCKRFKHLVAINAD